MTINTSDTNLVLKTIKKTCVFQVNVVFMAADHYDVEYDGM